MMGKSSLVSLTRISPNRTSPRTHAIDTITIHCYVGQVKAEDAASWFASKDAACSCNYFIDKDGRIASIVDESDRSWCSSNVANDHRAVTIECASDRVHPYAINDKVYRSLIKLCADICRRNHIKELKWRGDKGLIGQVEKQNMTVHRWFDNKACPGDYIYSRLGKIADEVNRELGQKRQNGLQAMDLQSLSEAETVAKVGPLFTEDQKKSRILACVSMAQFILESGYGKTDLARAANNCFGMKKELSGNTWPGSTWDGVSIFKKKTAEQKPDGTEYFEIAEFRKYSSVEESVGDHSAYLLGAMNGSKPRYAGLAGETDYRKAIQIIKNGGYATDVKYVDKLCGIIERWGLTKYNAAAQTDEPASAEGSLYRVRKTWRDASSQKGAFYDIDFAKKCADENSGYKVFDENGRCVYEGKGGKTEVPFLARVNIDNLRIRTGPGTNYKETGHVTGRGAFTITEVKEGTGSASGWGRLKSGAGWIALDYTKRM